MKGAGLGRREFPARAYLIETPKGFVVWDTGYASHFETATRGIYRIYPLVTPVHFDEHESLRHQLQHAGIAHGDVRTIVVSHFHADHIAGLRDFPNAARVCSMRGWEAVKGRLGLAALRKAFLPLLLPNQFEQNLHFIEHYPLIQLPVALRPFTRAWDLTGEGDILIVPLPGHAAGHLGAFIATHDGWHLLASDAAWEHDAYREMRGPSELSFLIQHNRRQYYETLRALHMLHREAKVQIHLTHEPDHGIDNALR